MSIIVLDIGGTFVKAGIFHDDSLYDYSEFPSKSYLGANSLLERCAEYIENNLLEKVDKLDGIGISTRGQVNILNGSIIFAHDSIRNYTGINIRVYFENKFNVPVYVENDVNAAAYGELKYGAGRYMDEQSFLCLTVGTGIGGAIVENAKLRHGQSFQAAEFGAMITHAEACKKGNYRNGCFEKYASTKALVKLCKSVDPNIKSAKDVFRNSYRKEINSCINKWAREFSIGLVTLIYLFNPKTIIIGGGIMQQNLLIRKIRYQLHELLMESFKEINIITAELGNKAGLYGISSLTAEFLGTELKNIKK